MTTAILSTVLRHSFRCDKRVVGLKVHGRIISLMALIGLFGKRTFGMFKSSLKSIS